MLPRFPCGQIKSTAPIRSAVMRRIGIVIILGSFDVILGCAVYNEPIISVIQQRENLSSGFATG